MTPKERDKILEFIKESSTICFGRVSITKMEIDDFIRAMPTDNTPTIKRVKEYYDSFNIDICEDMPGCEGCPAFELCDVVEHVAEWDIEKIMKVVNGTN